MKGTAPLTLSNHENYVRLFYLQRMIDVSVIHLNDTLNSIGSPAAAVFCENVLIKCTSPKTVLHCQTPLKNQIS